MIKKTILFDELEQFACEHACHFPSGSETAWLNFVWSQFVMMNQASYSNEIGRHIVLTRFLSLMDQINDFVCIAFSKKQPFPYKEAIEKLPVSTFRLGQMVGTDHKIFSGDEEELNRSALRHLLDLERPNTYNLIFRIFGGDSGLVVSLFILPQQGLDYNSFEELYEKYSPAVLKMFELQSSSSPFSLFTNFSQNR
ncbi:hypothetical protein QA601_01095 [Chitinispirillales bacterium ANBcel5]|uniref:hypothetical protein n=1 Tax=Cellulosispirillum alkaliphilum TaxID=3039283 RepID=UPI002A561460|nr:hypothetical protein [Chitinispirillales bacterium ANBcel5]